MSAYPAWPVEHIAWLEQNFLTGGSFSELAHEINRLFGTAYTRASIGGKCQRMRLIKDTTAPVVPKARVVVRRLPNLAITKRRHDPPARIESKRDCAWPDTPACTNKASIGSYCEAHARRAFKEMPSDARIARLRYQ